MKSNPLPPLTLTPAPEGKHAGSEPRKANRAETPVLVCLPILTHANHPTFGPKEETQGYPAQYRRDISYNPVSFPSRPSRVLHEKRYAVEGLVDVNRLRRQMIRLRNEETSLNPKKKA